jgi:hypothetical protein
MASERRSFPRYPVHGPAKLTLPDDADTVYDVTTNNLSRTSIQIECSADLIAALLRQQKLPYMCHLEFKLPWYKYTFRIDASVVTHRRLSQQQYVLVLLLRHNDAEQESLLDNQLGKQQKPIGLD